MISESLAAPIPNTTNQMITTADYEYDDLPTMPTLPVCGSWLLTTNEECRALETNSQDFTHNCYLDRTFMGQKAIAGSCRLLCQRNFLKCRSLCRKNRFLTLILSCKNIYSIKAVLSG